MENQNNGVQISENDISQWIGQEILSKNLQIKRLIEELAKKDAIIEQLQRKEKGK